MTKTFILEDETFIVKDGKLSTSIDFEHADKLGKILDDITVLSDLITELLDEIDEYKEKTVLIEELETELDDAKSEQLKLLFSLSAKGISF